MQIIKRKEGTDIVILLIATESHENSRFTKDLRDGDELKATYHNNSTYTYGHIELKKRIL